VANGSIVLDGATVGAKSLIAAGSVVAAGTTIPPGMLAAGAPAVVKRGVEGSPADFWVKANPPAYAELAQRHRVGITWVRD
jgi:carbonic anhydrase/acetyltransferase-like protein (isoleucine patch superfamily)